jgi:HD-GYP domain-containing protein (c-di-GMP phosphodiesterase class II)
MDFTLTPEDVRKSTEVQSKPYAIGFAILAAIGLAGFALIANYTISQRQNVLMVWQQTLAGVADVRSAAVSDWVSRQKQPLQRFAEDQEIRLSLMQIAEPSADLDLASRNYLRNWLLALARDNGYLPLSTQPVTQDQAGIIEAQNQSRSGVAIILSNGDMLASAGSISLEQPEIAAYIKNYSPASNAMLEVFKGPDGKAYTGFAFPIMDMAGQKHVALLIGIKALDTDVWPLLAQPGATIKSAQSVLLREHEGAVQLLSPTADKSALDVQFDLQTAGLIEAEAMTKPGAFASGKNHQGITSYGVSRRIEGAPWVLQYQASYNEIMADSDRRIAYQSLIFSVILLFVMAFLYASWRHGAAKIAAQKAIEYANLARHFEFQRKLLRLITDSQRNRILIADTEGRVRFANATLGKAMGVESDDLIGKQLAAAVGSETARRYIRRAQEANLSNRAVITVDRVEVFEDIEEVAPPTAPATEPTEVEGVDQTAEASEMTSAEKKIISRPTGEFRVVQTQHIPLEDRSAGENATPVHGTLIVEEDITDIVMEREKRERILRAVVESMVAVVDRRDPYAAEHSSRVAKLARMIAAEMGLSDIETESAQMAGSLLNLGKLLVPAQILTKETALDEAELKVVRDSLLASADIMSQIEFDGPVIETMRQSMERVDGTGFPNGLKGHDILITARIVAVANAFVALISARAHRAGLPLDKAIDVMMSSTDKAYDRGVVAALVNYLDNKGGRAEWGNTQHAIGDQAQPDQNPWQR